MDSFLVPLNAVGPLFLFLLLGWFLRRKGLLDASLVSGISRLTHYVFLPALLFKNVIDCDMSSGLRWDLVALAAVSSMLACLLAVGIACLTEKSAPRRAALAQGMFRNNYVTYGIAIATALYGPDAAGLVSMLIACIVPLNNIFAVIVLTAFSHQKLNARRLAGEVVTNPFVLAAALGFAVSALPFRLPSVLTGTLSSVSGMGVPLSMLTLGASFSFSGAGGYARAIAVGATFKLVLLPLCLLPVYVLLGFRNQALLALFIALSTPPAASSHIMAGQMGADRTLAAHLIVFGSSASILTLFAWLWLLRSMMLL